MRKIAVVSLFSIFLLASVTFAQESNRPDFKETNITTVAPDQVIDGDFFAHGEIVEISGTINGDLYAAGEKITINGTVNGDVLAAGGIININGTVLQNIRVAGGEVLINGTIGRNATVISGDLSINPNAHLKGNLVAVGGNTLLGGPIDGDAHLITGKMYRGPQAIIYGKLDEVAMPLNTGEINAGLKAVLTFLAILSFISLLITGLLFVHFFPNFNRRATQILQKTPLKTFFVGLITLIAMPFIIIALFVSLVGLPLGFIVSVLFPVLLYFAPIVSLYCVGKLLLSKTKKKLHDGLIFVTGLVCVTLVMILPFISFFVFFFVVVFGLGAFVIASKELYQTVERKK